MSLGKDGWPSDDMVIKQRDNEILRLQGELAVAHGQIRYLMKDQAVKFDLLAESQAREETLREALQTCTTTKEREWDEYCGCHGDVVEVQRFSDAHIDEALALPHDDTALKERLKAERERCAKYFEDRAERYLQDYAFGADMNYHADLLGYAEAIRNLGDE